MSRAWLGMDRAADPAGPAHRRHRVAVARILDTMAHFLYCPTMLGRRSARARWHHHLHLIPGRLLAWICDAYDRSLGLTDDEMRKTSADFYEDDESLEKVKAIFDRGPHGLTTPPGGFICPDGHSSISGRCVTGGTCMCGQAMVPACTTSAG